MSPCLLHLKAQIPSIILRPPRRRRPRFGTFRHRLSRTDPLAKQSSKRIQRGPQSLRALCRCRHCGRSPIPGASDGIFCSACATDHTRELSHPIAHPKGLRGRAGFYARQRSLTSRHHGPQSSWRRRVQQLERLCAQTLQVRRRARWAAVAVVVLMAV